MRIPTDVQKIIFNYIDQILLSEKLEFAFTEFMIYFGKIYAPISAGQFNAPPSIFNNFEGHDTYAAMEIRFKKAEVVFNHYCWTMVQAAIKPAYWIQKAMETIQWNGVAIMFREKTYEFIKLHGGYASDGVLSPNGFTMIDLADFATHTQNHDHDVSLH